MMRATTRFWWGWREPRAAAQRVNSGLMSLLSKLITEGAAAKKGTATKLTGRKLTEIKLTATKLGLLVLLKFDFWLSIFLRGIGVLFFWRAGYEVRNPPPRILST
ncbi:hypothetical protein AK812_SmicGene2655 [Symbiodinium microadriaticum]|uniref:Uncharacterized protein n=1 Tax=Symbiodinium microadriaticum TaxID=2951 RepID=A0A1Q9F112_SYMMI|nr:hypothetical protein AK812_SmicGene2655 [Symbiodinium microadriaticum]